MTDVGTIITVIACFIALLSAMIGLFIYLANKIDALQKNVYDEMRDFHGRMCKLEEQYIGIVQGIIQGKWDK